MPDWVRKGECNHCGYCCTFLGLAPVLVSPLEDEQFAEEQVKYHTWRKGIPQEGGAYLFYGHIYAPCEKHVENRCSVYEERPEVCKEFPRSPEQILGTPCSYWFEKVNESGRTVRMGGTGSPHPVNPRVEFPPLKET